MTNYPISCKGDVVVGDEIEFTEGVFGGSYRKPKFYGERTIRAQVIKDSYGEAKQQHTFTLLVIDSDGYEAIEVGKTIRRKGRNIYKNGTHRKKWSDESERRAALVEKHARGKIARAARAERRAMAEGWW